VRKNEKRPQGTLSQAATASSILAPSADTRRQPIIRVPEKALQQRSMARIDTPVVAAIVYAANASRRRDLLIAEECVCGTAHHFFAKTVSGNLRKRCPVTHDPIVLLPKVRRLRTVRRAA
jgi:hypothetical protein